MVYQLHVYIINVLYQWKFYGKSQCYDASQKKGAHSWLFMRLLQKLFLFLLCTPSSRTQDRRLFYKALKKHFDSIRNAALKPLHKCTAIQCLCYSIQYTEYLCSSLICRIHRKVAKNPSVIRPASKVSLVDQSGGESTRLPLYKSIFPDSCKLLTCSLPRKQSQLLLTLCLGIILAGTFESHTVTYIIDQNGKLKYQAAGTEMIGIWKNVTYR